MVWEEADGVVGSGKNADAVGLAGLRLLTRYLWLSLWMYAVHAVANVVLVVGGCPQPQKFGVPSHTQVPGFRFWIHDYC